MLGSVPELNSAEGESEAGGGLDMRLATLTSSSEGWRGMSMETIGEDDAGSAFIAKVFA